MSSVVLKQDSPSDTLSASGASLGSGGVTSIGPVTSSASGSFKSAIVFTEFIISQLYPVAPATTLPTSFSAQTTESDNNLYKFANLDILKAGNAPLTSQLYEEGAYVPMATTFAPPDVAIPKVFLNSGKQTKPIDYAGFNGTLTCNSATPVVVSCPDITATSVVEVYLIGGSGAGFTTAVASGLTAPVITIQLGATRSASTFTATGGVTGMVYRYKVLRG